MKNEFENLIKKYPKEMKDIVDFMFKNEIKRFEMKDTDDMKNVEIELESDYDRD